MRWLLLIVIVLAVPLMAGLSAGLAELLPGGDAHRGRGVGRV